MLVIGFNSTDCIHSSRTLDIDPDIDSARKIHDALKKATGGQTDYQVVVVVDSDTEVASFEEGTDYDLSDPASDEDDNVDDDEDDSNPDGLHDDSEDLDADDLPDSDD